MALKISQLAPVAVGTLDGSEPVELGIAGDKSAPNGAFLPPGYIDGLKAVWVGPNAVTFTSGSAYIPSLGRVVRLGASIAKAGLALAANTKYYAYFFVNAGVADVELSTTVPAAVYNGTARAKTGDTSRRYIGSVATDAAGSILAFKRHGNHVQYMASTYSGPLLVLGAGTATTPTSVSCAAVVPVTSQCVILGVFNNDTAIGVVIGTSDMGYSLTATTAPIFVNANSSMLGPILLDASQALLYQFRSSASSNVGMRVAGYIEER